MKRVQRGVSLDENCLFPIIVSYRLNILEVATKMPIILQTNPVLSALFIEIIKPKPGIKKNENT